MKKVTIIMAKVPIAGTVKTRMQPFLSETESADISKAFLLDAEQKVLSKDRASIIAFSPPNEEEKLTPILQGQNILIGQKGKDLGERMFNAFEFAFANGAKLVVMIGTDSPTFPVEFLDRAFELLEKNADVVLGETEDGGFFLIGFRGFAHKIFANVEWSTENAFQQTLSNINTQKLKLKRIPIWYDVDLPEDLDRLHLDLKQDPDSARHSQKWFEQSAKFD